MLKKYGENALKKMGKSAFWQSLKKNTDLNSWVKAEMFGEDWVD